MKQNRFHNLSLYRLIAPISIFMYHIFYIYFANVNGVYGLLSSAVQGFTFLSAFLYSQKNISSSGGFIKKNIWKVFFPAGIALGYMFVINCVVFFVNGDYSWNAYINTWCSYRAQNHGLLVEFGNYWYVILISGCYCMLPILQKLTNHKKAFSIFVTGVVVLDLLICLIFSNSLLFSPFVIGYAFGKKFFHRAVNSSYDKYDLINIIVGGGY